MVDTVNTVTEAVEEKDVHSSDLDQALAVAGFGWYNIKYCLVLAIFLIAAIVEPVGYSFVLPAAMCDLNMSDSQRGFIASIPYISIVITSFPWGYLVDTQGRKKGLIYSSLVAGIMGVMSAFMPNLISFTAFKFLLSLCIACSASTPHAYIGEILPAKNRDIMLSITNALQISGLALVPLCAWAIIPLDFRIDFGAYIFRPWRLLSIVYAMVFIIGAILLSSGPESPKYLVAQGKLDEALRVLQIIYANNKKKSPEDYPIKKLQMPSHYRKKVSFFTSLKEQSWPLLKPPYLKWMFLNGFLLFGAFAVLNGLYMWVPDVLNRVLTAGGGSRTVCQVIFDKLNQTTSEEAECDNTIDHKTFVINSVANICCAIIAVVISSTVQIIGKKRLLIASFMIIGTFCILVNFITQDMLFAVLLSSLPTLGLAVGPINAYSVEIFPTHLRGMAVSLSMMIGRVGSVIGTNFAGVLINKACEATFYSFGGLLFVCGVLAMLLPSPNKSLKKKSGEFHITRL